MLITQHIVLVPLSSFASQLTHGDVALIFFFLEFRMALISWQTA